MFDSGSLGILIAHVHCFFASVLSVHTVIYIYILIYVVHSILIFYSSHHSQVLLLQKTRWPDHLKAASRWAKAAFFPMQLGPELSTTHFFQNKTLVNRAWINGQGPGPLDDCIYKRKEMNPDTNEISSISGFGSKILSN